MIYKLQRPITTLDKRVLSQVEVKGHLTGADVLWAKREARKLSEGADTYALAMAYIARACGLLPEEVGEMDVLDIAALDDIVSALFSPKASEERSSTYA